MKLKDFEVVFHNKLVSIYGKNEVDSFFNILIKYFLNLDRITFVLNPDWAISKKEENQLNDALERLNNNEPIQYIIGETEFYGLKIKVNKHTLIPRPETEELVAQIIDDYSNFSKKNTLKIIDIGTGTGCIAISLGKHLKNTKILALDVSKDALLMAKHNAKMNKVELGFLNADILTFKNNSIFGDSKIDVIVSNPPYVRELEKEEMKDNVLNFEPPLALFVSDDDPLKFYKAITTFAINKLNKNGSLYFEINQYLGEEMKTLLEDFEFSNIELKKDIYGNHRFIKAIKQ